MHRPSSAGHTSRARAQDPLAAAQEQLEYEAILLDQLIDLFKQRCVEEAMLLRCEAQVSFEVLSRHIEESPQRAARGSEWVVSSWGPLRGDCWYKTKHGAYQALPEGPTLFAEVLASMMPKFVSRVKELGFRECHHLPGT